MSEARETFVERALIGWPPLTDALQLLLDDEISAWHDSDSTVDLAKWLGLTPEEYALSVEHPSSLSSIVAAHGSHDGGLSRVADSGDPFAQT